MAVIGTPAVVLELATPPGLVEVGKRVDVPGAGEEPGHGLGPERRGDGVRPGGVEGGPRHGPGRRPRSTPTGKVTFPPLDELRPGEAVTFTVEVEAVQAGDARFRAEVKAAHLTNPLKEEQAARVVGR